MTAGQAPGPVCHSRLEEHSSICIFIQGSCECRETIAVKLVFKGINGNQELPAMCTSHKLSHAQMLIGGSKQSSIEVGIITKTFPL